MPGQRHLMRRCIRSNLKKIYLSNVYIISPLPVFWASWFLNHAKVGVHDCLSFVEFSSPIVKFFLLELDRQYGPHKIADWDLDALLGARLHSTSLFPAHFLLHGSICRMRFSLSDVALLKASRL
jgi:hypothetical protein